MIRLTSRTEKESCSCEGRFRPLMNAPHVASPCSAIPAPCLRRCRIKARIFTRKELKQGLHEYLYSVNRPININAMGDYIYDHYGTETEVEE